MAPGTDHIMSAYHRDVLRGVITRPAARIPYSTRTPSEVKIHSSEQLEMILPARIIPYLFTDLECTHFSHIYPLGIQTIFYFDIY